MRALDKTFDVPKLREKLSKFTMTNGGDELKKGMQAAGNLVSDAAKTKINPVSGSLEKAMEAKVVQYDGGEVTVAIVGPRSDVAYPKPGVGKKRIKRNRGEKFSAWQERTKGLIVPKNYAHLVEFGHRSIHSGGVPLEGRKDTGKGVWNSVNVNRKIPFTAKGKPINIGSKTAINPTSMIPAHPFLLPALTQNESQALAVLEAASIAAVEKMLTQAFNP